MPGRCVVNTSPLQYLFRITHLGLLSTQRMKYAAGLFRSLLGSFLPCGGRSGWGVKMQIHGDSPPPLSSPNAVRHSLCSGLLGPFSPGGRRSGRGGSRQATPLATFHPLPSRERGEDRGTVKICAEHYWGRSGWGGTASLPLFTPSLILPRQGQCC
jgi:hypothetical protein